MNDIITELFDRFLLILNKLSLALSEVVYYILRVFDDCKYIYNKSGFIMIFSVIVSITFIILKSRKDNKLKKRFLSGFLISTGIFIVFAITGIIFLSSEFTLPDNIGFLLFIVHSFSQAVFIANFLTLFLAYIFMCIREKISD